MALVTLIGAPEALRRLPETNSAYLGGVDPHEGDTAVGVGMYAPAVTFSEIRRAQAGLTARTRSTGVTL